MVWHALLGIRWLHNTYKGSKGEESRVENLQQGIVRRLLEGRTPIMLPVWAFFLFCLLHNHLDHSLSLRQSLRETLKHNSFLEFMTTLRRFKAKLSLRQAWWKFCRSDGLYNKKVSQTDSMTGFIKKLSLQDMFIRGSLSDRWKGKTVSQTDFITRKSLWQTFRKDCLSER